VNEEFLTGALVDEKVILVITDRVQSQNIQHFYKNVAVLKILAFALTT